MVQVLSVLGIEPRAFHFLGKHSDSEQFPSPALLNFFLLRQGLAKLLRLIQNSQSLYLNLLSSWDYRDATELGYIIKSMGNMMKTVETFSFQKEMKPFSCSFRKSS